MGKWSKMTMFGFILRVAAFVALAFVAILFFLLWSVKIGSEPAQVPATEAEVNNIARLALDHYMRHGAWPLFDQDGELLFANRVQKADASVHSADGRMLGWRLNNDSWGNAYVFTTTGTLFCVSSPGKDGKFDTADDIVGTVNSDTSEICVRASSGNNPK